MSKALSITMSMFHLILVFCSGIMMVLTNLGIIGVLLYLILFMLNLCLFTEWFKRILENE